MKILDVIVASLLVIGGINWGLVGLFDFNLIGNIFGGAAFWSRLIYTAVGLAGVYEIVLWRTMRTRWHCTETLHVEVH